MENPLQKLAELLYTPLVDAQTLEDILGLDRHEINEPSSKCAPVLERGITRETCRRLRELLRWVACRAWQLIREDKADTWREAIRQAWSEAKTKCLELGEPI